MKFLNCFFFFCSTIFAQQADSTLYFRSPLDIPIQLSGNFGELRPNHFHSGFDFRTMQKEGLNVYAVADGYISRIKISTFGNGKTIYIDHPNGVTSVYGHLLKPVGKIAELIKKEHYKKEAYEIEIFPLPNELMVKKGELIALSGNTGSSEGPHLHFEFRDTPSEKVINPYIFGFDRLMKDTKKPQVTGLYVYPIEPNSVVNQSHRPLLLNLTLKGDENYIAQNVLAKGNIGFGIIGFDLFDNSYDKYGLYKVETFLNGNLSFGYEFNSFSFDETRYINAFVDYYKYKTTKQRIQKLFMKTAFPLSIIETDKENGVINVLPNVNLNYRIEVSDFYGNKTTITIPIQFAEFNSIVPVEITKTKYFIQSKTDSNFEKDNWSVFFPAGTFYDDFYMDFEVNNNVMTAHNDLVPVNNAFLVSFIDSSAVDADKIFIATIKDKKISYNNTKKIKNTFSTYTKNLGQFTLAKDTIAPIISISKPIEGKWINTQKTIELNISDNLSGIKSYNGYLNGKWILFEYENKTKKITFVFDNDFVLNGENVLKVEVIDNVGNSTIFETHFFRSNLQ